MTHPFLHELKKVYDIGSLPEILQEERLYNYYITIGIMKLMKIEDAIFIIIWYIEKIFIPRFG